MITVKKIDESDYMETIQIARENKTLYFLDHEYKAKRKRGYGYYIYRNKQLIASIKINIKKTEFILIGDYNVPVSTVKIDTNKGPCGTTLNFIYNNEKLINNKPMWVNNKYILNFHESNLISSCKNMILLDGDRGTSVFEFGKKSKNRFSIYYNTLKIDILTAILLSVSRMFLSDILTINFFK